MFHVGQKVVFIREAQRRGLAKNRPIVGGIYTVRCIRPNPWRRSNVGLLLEEVRNDLVVNPLSAAFVEPGFADYLFRPVKNTSIAVFEALLNKQPTPADLEDA